MTNQTRFNIWYRLAALAGMLLLQYVLFTVREVAPISYSDFERYLDEGRIAEIAVSDNFVQGRFKEPLPGGRSQFVTTQGRPTVRRGTAAPPGLL